MCQLGALTELVRYISILYLYHIKKYIFLYTTIYTTYQKSKLNLCWPATNQFSCLTIFLHSAKPKLTAKDCYIPIYIPNQRTSLPSWKLYSEWHNQSPVSYLKFSTAHSMSRSGTEQQKTSHYVRVMDASFCSWLKMFPVQFDHPLSPPPPRRWWPTLLVEVSERLGHAWTCLDMHGHAWNLCLFRQTVKKKVGQTYVTGAGGQGPPMWQVAGGRWQWQLACGRRVYSWCYLPRCPLSPPLFLSCSLALSGCVLSLI